MITNPIGLKKITASALNYDKKYAMQILAMNIFKWIIKYIATETVLKRVHKSMPHVLINNIQLQQQNNYLLQINLMKKLHIITLNSELLCLYTRVSNSNTNVIATDFS